MIDNRDGIPTGEGIHHYLRLDKIKWTPIVATKRHLDMADAGGSTHSTFFLQLACLALVPQQ